MINTMTQHDFTEWFRTSETRKDQFSYNGLVALFEYLESYEIDTASKIEFDPIALCGEWNEYESALECAKEYSDFDVEDREELDTPEELALDFLEERTAVVEFDGGVLVIAF